MFDPVWLGNTIVPRWEAMALVGGALVASCVVAFLIVVGACWIALRVGRRYSKMW